MLEQTGFEYIALDLDPYRIRVGESRWAIRSCMEMPDEVKVLENVGVAHANCVIGHFANPEVALRILRAVHVSCAQTFLFWCAPRTTARLEEGTAKRRARPKLVPETYREASLVLAASHLLLLLRVAGVSRSSAP